MAVAHYKYELVDVATGLIATAPSSNFKELLAGNAGASDKSLSKHFTATDLNWELRPSTTVPSSVTNALDQGFVIRDKATGLINIAIANGTTAGAVDLGSTLIDGATSIATTNLLVGLAPAAGLSDITTAGTFPARWTKWSKKATGLANTAFTQYKIVSGVDYIFVRFKNTADSKYMGGFFAGKALPFGARASGFCVITGLWYDWIGNGNGTGVANQSTYEYDATGRFSASARFLATPSSVSTLMDAPPASDGAGNYNNNYVCGIDCGGNAPTGSMNFMAVNAFPCLFVGPTNDALAKRWTVGGSNAMVNMAGAAWMCLDDGVNAE